MKKLRVAVVSTYLDRRGGIERRTEALVKGLIARGHEVHIYAFRWDPSVGEGAVFHYTPMLRISRAVKPLSFAWFCSAMLARTRYDIIHTQARIFRFDLATLGVGCYRAEREVMGISVRGSRDRWLDWAQLKLERSMMKRRPHPWLITNSALCRKELNKYYGVEEGDVIVVHNGVDSEAFSPDKCADLRERMREKYGFRAEDCVVLYVGNGGSRKGADTLIEALGRMKYPGSTKLIIVGRSSSHGFEKLAMDRGVADRVVFAGHSAHVVEEYSVGDIFALPTRYDPFANATMEALACGLPVITTDMNGVSEIMHDGQDGFVIKPNDPSTLAERLDLLAASPDLRRTMGAAGRKTVEPYTWDRTTEETVAVYHQIVASREAGK